MVKVKVCGLTNLDDALAAAGFGADALGFILAPSPRQVSPETVREIVHRLPPLVLTVGVFVDASMDRIREVRDMCGLDAVQLHGRESEQMVAGLEGRVIKAVRMQNGRPIREDIFPTATLLLDTYSPNMAGGTGRIFDWNLAVGPARHRNIFLAGGLKPENVTEAVAAVRPYAVDVSSGVEAEPGRKDHEKLEHFIRNAKSIPGPA